MKQPIRTALLAVALCSTSASADTLDVTLQMQRFEINRPYHEVVADFEQTVPLVNLARMDELVDTGADSQAVTVAIKEMTGESQLVRFYRVRTGDLFSVLGGTRVESVKYLVGNALIAQRVFTHGLTAGLHVPFVLTIYGDAGNTIMEYFQPSSFLAHVSTDPEVTAIGQRLDGLMADLIHKLGGP